MSNHLYIKFGNNFHNLAHYRDIMVYENNIHLVGIDGHITTLANVSEDDVSKINKLLYGE